MQLTKSQQDGLPILQKQLKKMEGEIAMALPKHMDKARFSRVVLTAVKRTPKLVDCTPASFFGSLLLSAQLGLEPNGPDQKCFLIPYGKECQFQLGYRGLLDLVRRFEAIPQRNKIILTTEKDAMRLELHEGVLWKNQLPVFVLPVEVAFCDNDEADFQADVKQVLLDFKV